MKMYLLLKMVVFQLAMLVSGGVIDYLFPLFFFLLGGSNIFKHFPLSSDILGLKATPKKTIPKSVKKNVPYIYIYNIY